MKQLGKATDTRTANAIRAALSECGIQASVESKDDRAVVLVSEDDHNSAITLLQGAFDSMLPSKPIPFWATFLTSIAVILLSALTLSMLPALGISLFVTVGILAFACTLVFTNLPIERKRG